MALPNAAAMPRRLAFSLARWQITELRRGENLDDAANTPVRSLGEHRLLTPYVRKGFETMQLRLLPQAIGLVLITQFVPPRDSGECLRSRRT